MAFPKTIKYLPKLTKCGIYRSHEYKRLNILDNLELFSSENENDYFPFHYHDFYCISLITKGTEILNNQEQEFIAPAGTISVTELNEVHRNYSLAGPGYSYRIFVSKHARIVDMFYRLSPKSAAKLIAKKIKRLLASA